MPNLTEAIEQAREGLATIDVDRHREESERWTAEIAKLDEVIASTRERIADLRKQAQRRRASGPNADIAARALLEGRGVLEAERSPHELDEEAAALQAGLEGLRDRRTDAVHGRDSARTSMAHEIIAVSQPLEHALQAEVRDAVRRFSEVYGLVNALLAATRNNGFLTLRNKLHRAHESLRNEGMVDAATPPLTGEVADFLRSQSAIFGLASSR